MMGVTTIEWTDRSVNPIRFGDGHYCQKISPGCAHCYASRLQPRFGNPQFGGTSTPLPMLVNHVRDDNDGQLWLDESKLQEVLRRKKPTKWFWADMTDLFGEWVTDEWIDWCFATMALTRQHTHQVLTKRIERARAYLSDEFLHQRLHEAVKRRMGYDNPKRPAINRRDLPLPNVWLGVSVEDQQRADERIPHLLRTPAAVRFLSVEPLLGPVDRLFYGYCPEHDFESGFCVGHCPSRRQVDWVIVGGESGPGARPMDVAWARSIVKQCQAAGVACFVKQLGSEPGFNPNDTPGSYHHCRDGLCIKKLSDRKGGDPAEWPEDLRVREFPDIKEAR